MTAIGPIPKTLAPHTPRFGTAPDPEYLNHAELVAEVAEVAGMPLLDWQLGVFKSALEVVFESVGTDLLAPASWRWRYPDVGIMVARQNGKTEGILEPRILAGLVLWDERIIHAAQNRNLPRESFFRVADIMAEHFADRVKSVRFANGQEQITTTTGGVYRIVASRPNSPRGMKADLLVLDEIRAYENTDFVAALLPTQNTSRNPQTWYASNAGHDHSVVLNNLRERGLSGDPSLCWQEWSADPALSDDDHEAWAQANPSLGTLIDPRQIERLRAQLSPAEFETEVLCRQVAMMSNRAIPEALWDAAIDPKVDGPTSDSPPVAAIDIDPDRASAALAVAWLLPDGKVATDIALYRTGPLRGISEALRATLASLPASVSTVGFDPWTTETLAADLASAGYITTPVTGRNWVAACQTLLELAQTDRLRHPGREVMATQMAYASRSENKEGRWWITRSVEPIPAVTATARAVYLASKPRPIYRIY